MKPTVYIETTIPSYYHDNRSDIALDIARTREWWDQERADYECFISPVVLDELSAGAYRNQSACLGLVQGLPLLATNSEVIEIAETYRSRRLMPTNPAADSIHLAVAAYYRMDYLLTWNCRHLANANKARDLETLTLQLGFTFPVLVTPHMLYSKEIE